MNQKNLLIYIIFLLIVAVRLIHIADSPYEYDSWRQSDTESIAVNFVEQRFNILYPQFNYDGPLPNVVQLELQITTFLIAVLYKIFGIQYALARIVPVLFFVGSACFLYAIARRYYNVRSARVALLLYGFLPLNMLYSRAIIPESAALFFYLGGFYLFSMWISQRRFVWLLASGCFTALAISQKIPTVFVGLPMLVMACVEYRGAVWKNRELWLFALLSLLPPYLYFQWMNKVAEFTFVSGIAGKHILPQMWTALFSPEAGRFFYQEVPRAFTWPALVLSAFGLARTQWKAEYAIGVWAFAMILESATIVAVIRFDYYLIFLSPLVALLSAKAMDSFSLLSPKERVTSSLMLLWIGLSSLYEVKPYLYTQKYDLLKQAENVQRLTGKEDLIVTGTNDPSLLNASRRRGWRIGNEFPDQPVAEMKHYRKQGARYFVPLNGYIDNDDGTVRRYLETHAERLETDKGYAIYRLK